MLSFFSTESRKMCDFPGSLPVFYIYIFNDPVLVTSTMFPLHAWQNVYMIWLIKGIFSDCNNIILWHESQDINKTIPKFKLIPISRLKVMHDLCFVSFLHRQLCRIKSHWRKLLSFHTEMISANSFGECALTNMHKIQILTNLRVPLYEITVYAFNPWC